MGSAFGDDPFHFGLGEGVAFDGRCRLDTACQVYRAHFLGPRRLQRDAGQVLALAHRFAHIKPDVGSQRPSVELEAV
ncbi:hypothetical protein B4U45_28280 [Mycobacterium persicum]|uniref:Uncharacterized protein n=1 Tax=Mycobacterium persicum TaxID=1487726 RepID=A0A8E2LMT6_9MYCO|nr:hypothetical protein A4G31_10490 [Mycobacterium persicum]ORB51919.1 hypothetical protein BST40_09840 [Mycobacterium persicum]ORB95073.1 hypothetical protein B1T44_11780 [Mycobacterium persicum]ORB98863.1 hypothetical protein B4U45_28280 [Mycobacterium persicum]